MLRILELNKKNKFKFKFKIENKKGRYPSRAIKQPSDPSELKAEEPKSV